ncbi:MAG: extracellular solute-binding protein [Azospirillum sp.]|nr:extracellular solute-binding protein [Azospirillum sp.]
MNKAIGAAAAVFGLAMVAGGPRATAVTLVTISCGSLGAEQQYCKSGAERWAVRTGNAVRVVPAPADAGERLAYYQQILANHTPEIDVFQIDVVWPAILGDNLVDLADAIDQASLAQHFPALVANGSVKGRLYAMPWFAEVGLLYYRKDLLERYGRAVPMLWSELADTALAIEEAERAAGNDRLWGFAWQGRASEALTCNALEWLDGTGGGTILDADGRVTIGNPRAAEAIDRAASWIGTISPPAVLDYDEEQARRAFQSGEAVFMRNWPYAWALANAPDSPVRGKIGIAALPKGKPQGRHAGTLGGAALAVSKYSRHRAVAADLVRFLTSAAEQKRRAVGGSFGPTLPALFQDREVLKANPWFEQFSLALSSLVVRPSKPAGVRYLEVSRAFSAAVHDTLAGRGGAADNLARLERSLDRVNRPPR